MATDTNVGSIKLPDKDLSGQNIVLLQSTVLHEMLDIATDTCGESHMEMALPLSCLHVLASIACTFISSSMFLCVLCRSFAVRAHKSTEKTTAIKSKSLQHLRQCR